MRRQALLQKMSAEKGIILFLGNVDSPAQYKDNCYKWRQDSSWLYFFGIDEPRFAATIDLESGEEVIYADDFTLDDILWMGPMPTVASQAAAVGVDKTAPYAAIADALKGRQVHFLPTSRYANMIMLGNLLGGLLINIRFTLLNKFNSEVVELLEIVRSVVDIAPFEA